MLTLPWRAGRDVAPGPVVVLATRLRLRRVRDLPAFLTTLMRLRRELPDVPGGVAFGFAGEPWRRTYWTLSAWRDEAALRAYVGSPGHAAAMRRFRGRTADGVTAQWVSPGGRPSWREARARIDGG